MIRSIEDGRREDGNRSIAEKIVQRLHELDKTIENNQGRWAWELLQNAKDSIAGDDDRTVSVQIQLDEHSVEFKHNGAHFTEQDVRGLINQLSSKEVEEGQTTQKTGRFGTGFLTTHLLSRVIQVKGIIETVGEEFYEFEFLLDRQGKTTSQLIPRIKRSWADFDRSLNLIQSDYDKNGFNTSFCYQLETDGQREIARVGVEEFSRLVPFVLTFIPKISRVEIIDNTAKIAAIFEREKSLINDLIQPISKMENGEATSILILCASNDKVEIAIEVEESGENYAVKSLKDFPKLFCDFPLIGTEDFYFPVIVNSFFFNPQTERDGIWLKDGNDPEVAENQKLLESAVELYTGLISEVETGNFSNLYHLVETRMPSTNEGHFSKDWYKSRVQSFLRSCIYNAKLVETETSKRRAIQTLLFPKKTFSEEVRGQLWQFIFDLAPHKVCKREHLCHWLAASWDEWEIVDYSNLVATVSAQENITRLSQRLRKSEDETFAWLNSFCKFVLADDRNLALFDKYAIIPNQDEEFKKESELYIDAIQDDNLIHILSLLGEDWRDILLHPNVNFLGDDVGKKEKKDIASEITLKLTRDLDDPVLSSYRNVVKAISLLSEWFERNPKDGKELFSALYRRRAEIFMNTIEDKESLYKVMRSCTNLSRLAEVSAAVEADSSIIEKLQDAKELSSLLDEFKASNVADLKSILRLARHVLADDSTKSEVTEATLLSLGVTSIAELEEALQDKGIAAQFVHTSTPSFEMFAKVQGLIGRAKANVIKHLDSIGEYDCSEQEELAPTVIGGIRKEGLLIYVVVRPSDNGEVIIYYSSEKDVLDQSNVELWIDNGNDTPRRLTLGEILKTTGISRIPV